MWQLTPPSRDREPFITFTLATELIRWLDVDRISDATDRRKLTELVKYRNWSQCSRANAGNITRSTARVAQRWKMRAIKRAIQQPLGAPLSAASHARRRAPSPRKIKQLVDFDAQFWRWYRFVHETFAGPLRCLIDASLVRAHSIETRSSSTSYSFAALFSTGRRRIHHACLRAQQRFDVWIHLPGTPEMRSLIVFHYSFRSVQAALLEGPLESTAPTFLTDAVTHFLTNCHTTVFWPLIIPNEQCTVYRFAKLSIEAVGVP